MRFTLLKLLVAAFAAVPMVWVATATHWLMLDATQPFAEHSSLPLGNPWLAETIAWLAARILP